MYPNQLILKNRCLLQMDKIGVQRTIRFCDLYTMDQSRLDVQDQELDHH
jgi:hypothetical protein